MKIEYDKIIVREMDQCIKREWVDLSTLIPDVPGKVQLMYSESGKYIVDACSVEEYEAGEGCLLLERLATCESIHILANEITKENNEPPIVKIPKLHIVESIENFIKTGKKLRESGKQYILSCNETRINK